MADYFKPRRGTLASATNKLVGENALRTGELFFELEYKEGTKEVKSGKIKIGGGKKDYANLNYVFDPDAYLELTDTFKVNPSSSSDISTNVGVINSTNTNITEKLGATSKALSLLNTELEKKPNKSDLIYVVNKEIIPGSGGLGTKVEYSDNSVEGMQTEYVDKIGYQVGDSKRAGSSIYAINASSATYAESAGAVAWGNVSGKPSSFTPSTHNHTIDQITNLSNTIKTTKVNNAINADTANYATSVKTIKSVSVDDSEINYFGKVTFNRSAGEYGYIFKDFSFIPYNTRINKLIIINGMLYDGVAKVSFNSIFLLTSMLQANHACYPCIVPFDNSEISIQKISGSGETLYTINPFYSFKPSDISDNKDIQITLSVYTRGASNTASLSVNVRSNARPTILESIGTAYCTMYDLDYPEDYS